jgi:hypothetical protein
MIVSKLSSFRKFLHGFYKLLGIRNLQPNGSLRHHDNHKTFLPLQKFFIKASGQSGFPRENYFCGKNSSRSNSILENPVAIPPSSEELGDN